MSRVEELVKKMSFQQIRLEEEEEQGREVRRQQEEDIRQLGEALARLEEELERVIGKPKGS